MHGVLLQLVAFQYHGRNAFSAAGFGGRTTYPDTVEICSRLSDS